jgi:hypothetical protein
MILVVLLAHGLKTLWIKAVDIALLNEYNVLP